MKLIRIGSSTVTIEDTTIPKEIFYTLAALLTGRVGSVDVSDKDEFGNFVWELMNGQPCFQF